MKGYKKFLQIDCIENYGGEKRYEGICKIGLFYKKKYVNRGERRAIQICGTYYYTSMVDFYYLDNHPCKFDDIQECKKALKENFLSEIRKKNEFEKLKIKRKFKIWP